MKPKFLLVLGNRYSGLTPFYYTLAVNHKYCHAGHVQDLNYLSLVQCDVTADCLDNIPEPKAVQGLPTVKGGGQKLTRLQTIYQKVVKLKEEGNDYDDDIIVKHPVLRKYYWDEEHDYWKAPFTLDKYVEYYLKHWDYIKDEYQSVADFSSINVLLKPTFISKLKTKLEEHFDVRVVHIMQDPIRALYDRYGENSGFERALRRYDFESNYRTLGTDFNNSFARKCKSFRYTENSKIWKDVFGDKFYPVVMEEFWDNPSGLSLFLGYSVDNLYKNIYYPDQREIKEHINTVDYTFSSAKYFNPLTKRHFSYSIIEENTLQDSKDKRRYYNDFLKDSGYCFEQYNLKERMTDENLQLAKEKLKPIYQAFKEYFGYMPSAWQSS